ncbi:MAG TPA: YciI family protein [Acidimicrobiales bacterium]|nr:YciI family protein [Acidimicrobiales bacterium]
MAQYLVLLEGLAAQLDATDAEPMAHNQRWMDWLSTLGAAGQLAGGGPLGAEARGVGPDGVSDRELQTVDVFGYLVLEATSLDEAAALASQAPNVALGGTAVVRPVLAVGG